MAPKEEPRRPTRRRLSSVSGPRRKRGGEGGARPVRFRGSPPGLSAVLPLPEAPEAPGGLVEVELDVPEVGLESSAVAAQAVEGPEGHGLALVGLNLPRLTPPGTYRGTVRVGGQEHPAEIEVEPRTRLRLDPRRLLLRASAGATVTVDVLVMNLGNVGCSIADSHGLGLFDVGGMERAVGRAFRRTELAEGERRVDVLTDELARGYGGLVKIEVEEGAGELAPGEARELRLAFHLPRDLRPGYTYWGTWPLHNVRYYVRVEVEGGKGRTSRSREGEELE